ncbi:surfeit locus protein 2 [Denticeps clupeoides]|uniref:Surfeit locus protein 2 n=1 Tax=Denticeps clupeoides TaxID=299321 RepID=A0AAY4BFH2_9TELE|nr:surfeit locus protein 2 [Denticeps clupeoides]
MEHLPADLKAFLQNHPFLQLTDAKKIRCTLNGHELPCQLDELRNFTDGKRYKSLSACAEFDYGRYEPHVVPSTKQPNHLFCKLTLRHINRLPHHVLLHVNGKRFKRALQSYEECLRQGVQYVPASLKQKSRPKPSMENEPEKKPNAKEKGEDFWAPNSSEGEDSDKDSMEDLYPSSLFTLKKPENEEVMEKEEDGFHTDEEEMEVSSVVEQVSLKRKKVQSGGFKKKFKNHQRKRKGFKKIGKVQNGK